MARLTQEEPGAILLTNNAANAEAVFRQFGLEAIGFWRSVAVPPDEDGVRPGTRLKEAFEQLGGLYPAFARFLLWRADLLGVEFLTSLRQIRHVIPPVPRNEVAALLVRELGAAGEDLARQLEEEPVWSTLSRTAYLSWHQGAIVVVQVAREPVSDAALAEFEKSLRFLGHPDVAIVTTPAILSAFRQWLRQAQSSALERAYLEVLGRSKGQTLVEYPALIPEITTDHILCWPWVEGETVTSLIRRGSVDTISQVGVAVLEQYCSLSIVDAELDSDAIIVPTGQRSVVVRRLNRPLSVPPPLVNAGMKYIAAVLEGNASMTVQSLVTLAVGQSKGNLESALLELMSAIEPELKVNLWFPGSASAFESNWRALATLEVPRPLFLDCLHRNLMALGYWTAESVVAGGPAVDTIAEAHGPVVERLLRLNAAQFLDPAVLKEWSVGIGLLAFGTMREANRLAEEVRENNLTLEVDAPETKTDERPASSPAGWKSLVAGALLIVLLASLRWGSTLQQPAAGFALAVALLALLGLFWVVAKID